MMTLIFLLFHKIYLSFKTMFALAFHDIQKLNISFFVWHFNELIHPPDDVEKLYATFLFHLGLYKAKSSSTDISSSDNHSDTLFGHILLPPCQSVFIQVFLLFFLRDSFSSKSTHFSPFLQFFVQSFLASSFNTPLLLAIHIFHFILFVLKGTTWFSSCKNWK